MKSRLRFFKKVVMILVVCVVMAAAFAPANANAATKRVKNIKKLVSQMDGFEYKVLSDIQFDIKTGDVRKIKLNAANKVFAASMALDTKILKTTTVENDEEYWESYEEDVISTKSMKQSQLDMFGNKYGVKYLQDMPSENIISGNVYKRDGRPVIRYAIYIDFEYSLAVRNTTVDGNKVYKDIYYGYWGCDDDKSSNFRITYTVKKNSVSKYGYVITGMKVEKTADEWTFTPQDPFVEFE